MKLTTFALGALLIVAATNAPAQGAWVEFARPNGSTASFDQTTIEPDLSREVAYFAWWRADLSAPSIIDGKSYTSHLGRYRVDCMRRTLQQSELLYFSAAGKQVAADGTSSEALPIANTLGATFVKVICARAGR